MNDLITITQNKLNLDKLLENDPHLKSAHTRNGYRRDLEAFEAWRASRPLTRLLVEAYAADLQGQGRSPNTINRKLAAIRWLARRMADQVQEQPSITDQDQRQRAELVSLAERVASVKDVRGSRQPKGRHITTGELSALMTACENDPTPAGARDAALIAIAWAAGLRRAELAELALSSFIPNGEDGDLVVHGKGDKHRAAYLYDGAFLALAAWLEIRGNDDGPLFCAIGKSGKVKSLQHLSGESLRLILEKRIEESKVKPLTWHDFRRSFAGNLLDSGSDLATVQKLMGHRSPVTTSNYDRRSEETQRKAVRALFVPFRGR